MTFHSKRNPLEHEGMVGQVLNALERIQRSLPLGQRIEMPRWNPNLLLQTNPPEIQALRKTTERLREMKERLIPNPTSASDVKKDAFKAHLSAGK